MTARGMLTCAFVFPFIGPAQRMWHVGKFAKHMLAVMGLRLVVEGAAHPGPVLLVSNHVSWLDILVINASQPARFVSKADVRRWPVIGWIVACGGTLFIERERKRDAMRVVHQVAEALRHGQVIAMFPEGTTSDGQGLLPFHANLLQAAVATHVPVQPIALRFSDAASPVSAAVPYIGDTNLMQSLWSIVCARGLRVRVQRLPAIATEGLDRRAISERARVEIAAALGLAEEPAAAASACAD